MCNQNSIAIDLIFHREVRHSHSVLMEKQSFWSIFCHDFFIAFFFNRASHFWQLMPVYRFVSVIERQNNCKRFTELALMLTLYNVIDNDEDGFIW